MGPCVFVDVIGAWSHGMRLSTFMGVIGAWSHGMRLST
jgi:hypothetical protein